MCKAKVSVLTVRVRAVDHKGCQVIKDERQIDVELDQGAMDDILPDVAGVLADGIQRPPQTVVVELFCRYTQRVDEYRPR